MEAPVDGASDFIREKPENAHRASIIYYNNNYRLFTIIIILYVIMGL